MEGETQGSWIGRTVRRKGRADLGIGIPAWIREKTYTLPLPFLRQRLVLHRRFGTLNDHQLTVQFLIIQGSRLQVPASLF